MSFKTVLETALTQKIITPAMKQVIEESLFSLMMSAEEMETLGTLLSELISGEVEVVDLP
jgi:Trp operon repressor